MEQAAVFLDRDNTVVEDPGYLADPNQVKLLPGAAEAIHRWNEAGYRVVMVTNQSGLARGLITEAQLEDIHAQLELLLEADDAEIDAIYYCPYLDGPEAIVPKFRRDSSLRKPKPGMLLKAAEEMNLDLEASWMVGDGPADVQAGLAAGCKTVLLTDADESAEDLGADYVAESLSQAADIVLDELSDPETQEIDTDEEMDSPMAEEDDPIESDQRLAVLKDIRSLLEQQRRESAQNDFSLARLGATLFQIVAVCILLWGLAAFVSAEPVADVAALQRFALATVVQLIALTLYVTDRLH
jgi:D-glycero-D-manno-heptose 1,7-bisphosphate phosphatase